MTKGRGRTKVEVGKESKSLGPVRLENRCIYVEAFDTKIKGINSVEKETKYLENDILTTF